MSGPIRQFIHPNMLSEFESVDAYTTSNVSVRVNLTFKNYRMIVEHIEKEDYDYGYRYIVIVDRISWRSARPGVYDARPGIYDEELLIYEAFVNVTRKFRLITVPKWDIQQDIYYNVSE